MAFPAAGLSVPTLQPYQFSYQGYTFGPYTPFEMTKIEGIDLPTVRNGDAGRPRASGRFVGLDVLDGRDITVTGQLSSGPALLTNLFPNPSFEYDAIGSAPAGWASSSFPTTQVQAGWSARGSRSLRLTTASLPNTNQETIIAIGPTLLPGGGHNVWPVAGNQTVNLSAAANVLSITGQMQVYLEAWWYDATGAFISATTTSKLNSTGVGSLSGTLTAPSNAAYLQVTITAFSQQSNSTMDLYVDALAFGTNADGDTPGWVWNGAPGDSPSQTYQGGQTLQQTWLNLANALSAGGTTEYPLYLNLPGFGTLVTLARPRKRPMPLDIQAVLGNLVSTVLGFSCSDPRWYATPTSTSSVASPGLSGGFAFPIGFPLFFGGGSSVGALAVINSGNIDIPAILTVTGPCTNPSITNASIPGSPNLTFNLTMNAGDQLILDTDMHTATYYTAGSSLGASRLYTLAAGSQWFTLWPANGGFTVPDGSNTLQFITSDASPTGTLSVSAPGAAYIL